MSIRHDIIHSRKPLAGFFAIGAAWSAYFAQVPVIKTGVGASDGAYGMALLFASCGAIAAMWLAPAFRRFGGGRAVSMGIAIVAVGMAACGMATSLFALTVAMFLAAVGSGVVDVLVNARVSGIEKESRAGLTNLNHALYSFAYAAGALATGTARSAGLSPELVSLVCLWSCSCWYGKGRMSPLRRTRIQKPPSAGQALRWSA